MDLSVVVPLYNEVENLSDLYTELKSALDHCGKSYEIVLVDDGSRDGTAERLHILAREDHRVRAIVLRRNYGQTAAMKAGIDFAVGDVIVTIDGDLQNDPADIPAMLKKIDEGYDLVHGWRKNRQDAWINRKLPSKIANWLISRVTGFPIHDLGCTLKAIRADIAKELELYGEMHRFIPILAFQRGAKCIEVVTHHRPRTRGVTKYGIGRTTRVILDLLTVKFMLDYSISPMKIFGRIGLFCSGMCIALLALSLGMKLVSGVDITGNPVSLLSIVAGLASIQFFSLGLLGEFSTRIYLGQSGRQHYSVRHHLAPDQQIKPRRAA